MKYNTVLFIDRNFEYYIGNNKNSKITEIRRMDCSNDSVITKLDGAFEFFALNEFYIVKVEHVDNAIKLTPITSCTLTKTDSEEEIASNLCDMTNDELLKMFNDKIPEKYLNGEVP
jgi:hypothetical protein